MRFWHFLSSVNSFFKYACAAIQSGYMSNFKSDSASTSIIRVCEQRRLWRGCGMRRLAWAFAGRLCDKYHNLAQKCLRQCDRLIWCKVLSFAVRKRCNRLFKIKNRKNKTKTPPPPKKKKTNKKNKQQKQTKKQTKQNRKNNNKNKKQNLTHTDLRERKMEERESWSYLLGSCSRRTAAILTVALPEIFSLVSWVFRFRKLIQML